MPLSLPVTFIWQRVVTDDHGERASRMAMVPLKRYDNLAGRQFEGGQEYALEITQPMRSKDKARNRYFASVDDGFANLPENIVARWPSPTHLRKWLLVETGWFEEKDFECADDKDGEAQAYSIASFVRTESAYARISIHKFIDRNGDKRIKVIVRRARSQAKGVMSDEDFKASSEAVLTELSHMIGVSKTTLKKEAASHA